MVRSSRSGEFAPYVRFLFGIMTSQSSPGFTTAAHPTPSAPPPCGTPSAKSSSAGGSTPPAACFGISPSEAGFATGIPELDRATGFDGIPRGRVSELTGPPGSGALTLGLRALATALDHGGLAAYVDLPGTFAPTAGAALGLDLSRLVLVRPPDADTALQATATLLRSNAFEALLLDLEVARPRANRWSHLADLAGRGAAGLVVVTASVGPRVTGLPYLASLRLGVACRGWRWQPSRLTQVPVGLTLEVRVLKSRSGTGVQQLVIDCPFLRRSGGSQDALPLDAGASAPRWKRKRTRRGRRSHWRSTRRKLTSGG